MNLAQRITIPAERDDSALEPQICSEIEDLVSSGRLKPGFRALFHGPSGTGKTLAAALLGGSRGAAGLPDRSLQGARVRGPSSGPSGAS